MYQMRTRSVDKNGASLKRKKEYAYNREEAVLEKSWRKRKEKEIIKNKRKSKRSRFMRKVPKSKSKQ